MISCRNIHKSYGKLHVLKGISLEINPGEIVTITGESGAGKSTLLHILGTLDKADEGEIVLNDKNISSLSNKKLSAFRNKNIGFIFQFHQLLPEFTAAENVCIPAWIAGKSKKIAQAEAYQLLDYLGLKDRMHHKPGQLSGGEQQRVAVARALINKPSVVFADEPSGNLDSTNAELLHQYFLKLSQDFGQTMVIVTHNADLSKLGNRNIKLKDGIVLNES